MDRLLARAGDSRPAVQEKAIRVLSRHDAGQGVPTLIDGLGDSRSSFAIYGLRAAVLRMGPAGATEVLSKAPLAKVTVAKEVVRLLGELRDEGAYRRVLELANGELHRDVRIAVLRAFSRRGARHALESTTSMAAGRFIPS
jgi:cellulose synthase operon protein C